MRRLSRTVVLGEKKTERKMLVGVFFSFVEVLGVWMYVGILFIFLLVLLTLVPA